jgi:hypothetical protein
LLSEVANLKTRAGLFVVEATPLLFEIVRLQHESPDAPDDIMLLERQRAAVLREAYRLRTEAKLVRFAADV